MSDEKWIYKLSDYQIGVLGSYFRDGYAPMPHTVSVENVMLVGDGDMIVDIIKYGVLCRNRVPHNPGVVETKIQNPKQE